MENYFDLYDILVNQIFGDIWLLTFAALLIVFVYAIKKKVPFEAIVLFQSLVLLAIYKTAELPEMLVFVLMAGTAIFYYQVSKAIGG